jgi:Ca-activated chloride channel family protein
MSGKFAVLAVAWVIFVAGCTQDVEKEAPSSGTDAGNSESDGCVSGGDSYGPSGDYWTGSDAGAADGGGISNIGTGGAQDIGQFRKIRDEGGIPGQSTLDANGFFSEHHTQLPAPDCGEVICLHGLLGIERDWVYLDYLAALQLGLNSPLNPAEFDRRPLDLVVVVDTSGSMAESDKLSFVKQGLHLLIDQIEQGDRMALVTYSGTVTVHYGLDSQFDPALLHNLVDSLRPDGSTNFYDGLRTGLSMAAQAMQYEREPRVLMLSDGQPTEGITDDQSIISMADGYISQGIGLTTIGVGIAFNVELMRGLAERGAGNFYFLEDSAAIEEVFTEELHYFVTPIAYDLELKVEAAEAYTLGEVVGTTMWSTSGNIGKIEIPSLFLASRTSYDDPPAGGGEGRRGGGSAIILSMLPGAFLEGIEDPHQVAALSLRYRPAGQDDYVYLQLQVDNPTTAGTLVQGTSQQEPWVSHQAMRKNFAMYNVFLGLREACRLAADNYDHALWVLDRLKQATAAFNSLLQDDDIASDLVLIEKFRKNLIAHDAEPVEP